MAAAADASSLDRMNYAMSQFEGFMHTHSKDIMHDDFRHEIQVIMKDWRFLRTLWESIRVLRDDKLFDLGVKIEAAAEEIAQELIYNMKKEEQFLESMKYLDPVEYYERETNHLMAEIGEALDHRLSGCSECSFRVLSTPDISFWTRFVDSVKWNVNHLTQYASRSASDTIRRTLRLIHEYMDAVCSDPHFPAAAAGGGGGDDIIIINDFLKHVASVILRIAILSCNYWVHRKVQKGQTLNQTTIKFFELVVDWKHEIDSTNPRFMEFLLRFLIALCRIGGNKASFCRYFSNYVVHSRVGHFENELSQLVVLLVDGKLEQEEEKDQILPSFVVEINLLLVEAASPFKGLHGKELLLKKICLLETELFLKELLLPKSSSRIFQIEDQLNQIKYQFDQMLESLRRFFKDLQHQEAEKKTLALIEQVYYKVASLYKLFGAKKITESMVKNSFLLLLLNIVIFKAEPFFKELLLGSGNAAKFMASWKDQIALLEQLDLFTLLSNQLIRDREEMDMIFSQTETFARGTAEDTINIMILSSSELLDKVKHIKAKVKEISPQFPLSDLPKTSKLGFVDILLRNLEELLKYNPASSAPIKHHIKQIQLHFKSLISFLMKVSEWDIDENPELKDLGNHVANIAYKIEYVVDSIERHAQWQHFFWFYDLLEELRIVNQRASRIHLTTSDVKVQDNKNVSQVPLDMISQDGRPAINEAVVDLSNEEQVVIDQLTRGSSGRGMISIVGMPGIGKTTLAWKVYNCQNVMYHFHRRAWCTVSQAYEKRDLLLEILSNVHGLTCEIRQMSNEDLQSKLRQCLLKNKYLIVMDDVWDAGAWNYLKNSFPDDANGSRILITSRLRDVALRIEPNGDPHTLRLFSDDESWNLLEGKVFNGEGCPRELLLVGKEIAQKCKGLPLAVVAISGLLQRTEKSRKLWEEIAESLSSKIMEDPEAQCMEILEVSYKHLPEHLKACFLYLGVFLEDKDIPISKLIRFWLAEGFIQNTELKSLEGVAEDYLMELINRSLVVISKRRSNGKVKACRLHDLLRDFCQLKAKEENFLQLVTRFDEPYVSFPSSDFGFEFDFGHYSDPVTYEAYRLCIFLKRVYFVESRPFGLGTRSLIFFPSTDSEPRCPYDISFICHNFKYLRVLDLECINLGINFPVDIGLLVQLRYLAVSGYMRSIPQSIANLRKLETFVVKGLRGQVVLPHAIWHMTRLRHLHVNIHVAFDLDDKDLGICSKLENLVSFSRPSLSCGEDTEKLIKRLPNLRKLKCIFVASQDSSKTCNQFPRLDFLTHLESLNVYYFGRAINTGEFILPSNLRKLTLSNFRLPWYHISAVGRLPNLEVLKLLSGAFEGRIWNMGEEEFQELKFLKLDTLNIAQWNASCDHLPKLERLVLQNCEDLEEIPSDFADINTLEMIEVHWCGQSAENSAKEIGKATEGIKVHIN